jgi:hypothetical protein
MTQDIEAALEEIEENVETTEEVVNESPAGESDTGEGSYKTEPELVSSDGEADPATEGESDSPAATEESGSGEVEKETAPAVDEPPAGLSPQAREEWKDTPPEMKKAIAKREEQFAQGIFQYQADAKRAHAMDGAMKPHQQLFALNGNNPPEMVGNLLQTASLLQMGTPAQKAQVAAKIISDFGVDIATLDSVLSGAGVPRETSQPQQNVQEQINQALAHRDQQHQQNHHNQQMNAVQGDINAFAQDPKNEFYKDVYPDMADILEMAGNRGLNMDMPTAYARACQLRPDIKAIIDGRTSGANVGRANKAAVSISGSPGGDSNVGGQEESISDTIRRAMGESGNRV